MREELERVLKLLSLFIFVYINIVSIFWKSSVVFNIYYSKVFIFKSISLTMKYVVVLCLIGFATYANAASCKGCTKTVDESDFNKTEELLNKSLSKLAAGEGPVYKLVKINSATTQVVSGSLDKINADLKDENEKIKTCDISIWSQPWLENGIEVTFNCPGEEKVVKKHSA